MKLALDHVNEHSEILRNYRLHMWWNDTMVITTTLHKQFFFQSPQSCYTAINNFWSGLLIFLQCNAAVGVKAFFDMMHSGPHKLMLFGAACTQVTDPIAKASKHWHLTQVCFQQK